MEHRRTQANATPTRGRARMLRMALALVMGVAPNL